MKYHVVLACTVDAHGEAEVEASSPEEAARIAIERQDNGDWPDLEVSWECASETWVHHVIDDAGKECDIPEDMDINTVLDGPTKPPVAF